jgi:hypothetical protein
LCLVTGPDVDAAYPCVIEVSNDLEFRTPTFPDTATLVVVAGVGVVDGFSALVVVIYPYWSTQYIFHITNSDTICILNV